jgi:hypothetical protein
VQRGARFQRLADTARATAFGRLTIDVTVDVPKAYASQQFRHRVKID